MKSFKKRVIVNFGEPFKVNGDLEKANEKLRNIIIDLIEKGREEYEKK